MKKLFGIIMLFVLLCSCATIHSRGVVQQSENTYLVGVRGEGWDNVRKEVKRLADEKCPGYKILSTREKTILGRQKSVYWTIECPEGK